MNKYIDNPKKSYKIINLKYNDSEKRLLKKINVCNDFNFRYFGNYNSLTSNRLQKIIDKICDNNNFDKHKLLQIINKLILLNVNLFNATYIYFNLNVSSLEQIFRWHYDDLFFYNSNDKPQFKFITVLTGQGTLLCDPLENVRNKFIKQYPFNEYDNIDKWNNHKNKLNKILLETKIVKLTNFKGAFLRVGSLDVAAIHSEPNNDLKDSKRMLLTIVVGSKKEIDELKNKWK
jgi:hypothetical protein